MDSKPSSSHRPTLTPSSAPTDIKEQIKISYDAIAQRYLEWGADMPVNRREKHLEQLLARLPAKKEQQQQQQQAIRILELGCGAGDPGTKMLLSQNPNIHVTANDISSVQLRLLRENSAIPQERVTTVEGDMMALTFEEGSFDAVIGLYTIFHLPKGEQPVMLQRIAGWLAPGGWFLANFGGVENEGQVSQEWLGHKDGLMYWSSWGISGTCQMVESAGLRVETAQEVLETEDSGEGPHEIKFLWIYAQKK